MALVRFIYPKTFRFQDSLQISSFISNIFPGGIAPALLIKMSTFPENSATFSAAPLSDKSIAIISTDILYFFCKSYFTLINLSSLRAVNIKLQPSSAIDSAIAFPIPFDAPVIKAVLLFKFNSIA